ncbi:MAG: signal peptidase II [Nitrospinota bacterium]|nr:signal peptidase II [Nitrospinota bacterium]
MKEQGGSNVRTVSIIAMVITTLAVADQYTKGLVEARLSLGESMNIIPGFFDIVYITNKGAAFGFLSGVDSVWVHRGFTAFTLVAMVALVMMYRSFPPGVRLGRVAAVMIAAGAVGNLIDRIEQGYVTDFLLVYIGKYQWPAFNLADSLISVGVVFMAYSLVFLMGQGEERETDGTEDDI